MSVPDEIQPPTPAAVIADMLETKAPHCECGCAQLVRDLDATTPDGRPRVDPPTGMLAAVPVRPARPEGRA